MELDKVVVIIPALNPDEKLLKTLSQLMDAGYGKIILVNDGSRKEQEHIFGEALKIGTERGVALDVLKHSVNLGQGRAYKTAFNFYLEKYPDAAGVIQCDADGQHHIDDVLECTRLLLERKTEFILGVRDFDSPNVPFRSRFGNKCTSVVLNLFCGINVRDTQTGLKGIPSLLIPYLMETPGERFEYATSVLLEVKKRDVPITQFPIQTIYINGNESSHFNPLLDSIRIYSMLLRYILSSLSAFVIDIALFALFVRMFRPVIRQNYILAATYLAKCFSCTYTFFVNRRMVFGSRGKLASAGWKFVLLCILQATASSLLVQYFFGMLQWNEIIVKVIVDTVLFFVSFVVQQKWVFAKK